MSIQADPASIDSAVVRSNGFLIARSGLENFHFQKSALFAGKSSASLTLPPVTAVHDAARHPPTTTKKYRSRFNDEPA
jgi:hypothetical protein